jgi:hypothetical protein
MPIRAMDLGFDAKGNAVAVGIGDVGAQFRYEAVTRAPGGNWSQPDILRDTPTNSPENGRVVVNSWGEAAALWATGPWGDKIWVQRRAANGIWGEAHQITTKAEDDGEVVIDESGVITVTWTEIVPGPPVARIVRSIRGVPGEEWSAPVNISQPADGSVGMHALAANPAGDVISVWAPSDPAEIAIRERPAGMTWQPETQVDSGSGVVRYPVVAINASRDAVVAWDLQSGPTRKIMGITRRAGGAWEEDSK